MVVRLRPTDRILEVGCGTGTMPIRLTPDTGQWIATEPKDQMIRIAPAKPAPDRLSFHLAEASETFQRGTFDVVCAFNPQHLVGDIVGL